MFDPKDIADALGALGYTIDYRNDAHRDPADPPGAKGVQRLTERLNVLLDAKPPSGAPPLTLAKLQARAVITLLSPLWAMHSIKIAAYEKCVTHRAYAGTFLTPTAQSEIRDAREALKQINYVFHALVEFTPLVQVEEFVTFGADPATGVLMPLYNHPQAMKYAHELAAQWEEIPLIGDARTVQ